MIDFTDYTKGLGVFATDLQRTFAPLFCDGNFGYAKLYIHRMRDAGVIVTGRRGKYFPISIKQAAVALLGAAASETAERAPLVAAELADLKRGTVSDGEAFADLTGKCGEMPGTLSDDLAAAIAGWVVTGEHTVPAIMLTKTKDSRHAVLYFTVAGKDLQLEYGEAKDDDQVAHTITIGKRAVKTVFAAMREQQTESAGA